MRVLILDKSGSRKFESQRNSCDLPFGRVSSTMKPVYRVLLGIVTFHVTAVSPSSAGEPQACSPFPLCDPGSPAMQSDCPPFFTAEFHTTAGNFSIDVNRSWSPHAAARFYNLVRLGWYNDTYFFRVIDGFVTQFGLSGLPSLQAQYCNDMTCSNTAVSRGAAVKPDTGQLVGPGNVRGTVAYSLMSTGGNASVEVFINTVNNSRLDSLGFRPFGIVPTASLAVVDALYAGYGELNQSDICPDPTKKLCKGPKLQRILDEGNAYLTRDFPLMSETISAFILSTVSRDVE